MEQINQIDTTVDQLPKYSEIFKEVGKQLNLRKKDILKRALLATWPIALLLGGINIYVNYFKDSYPINSPTVYILLFLWVIFTLINGAVVRTIFALEKRLWIDSYFDGKNLTSKQSWKISKKLLVPSLSFRVYIFLRYYVISWIIYFGLLISLIYSWTLRINPDDNSGWWLLPVILLGFPVLMWIYAYYLRIKLRYIWFLFVDMYSSQNYSFSNIIKEMNNLNSISKTETFKKALLIDLGSDSIETIANGVLETISTGLGSLSKELGVVSDIIKAPAKEIVDQATSFANISAIYLLYRQARKLSNKSIQIVNEKIYSLLD